MISKVIIMVIINLLCIDCKLPDHIISSKNSIQHITKSMPSEHLLSYNISRNSYSGTETLKPPVIFSTLSSPQNEKNPPKNAEGSTFKEIWYLLNKWLTKISQHSYRLKINKLTTEISDNFSHKQLKRNHITFFPLWMKILRNPDDKNFTLNSFNRSYNDSYGHRNEYESKTKGIIVEDARYTSLIEKWITNRHARDGDMSKIVPQRHNVSTSMNLINESQSSCGTCLNESIVTPSGNISQCLNENSLNGSKLETCNVSHQNGSKAADKSNDDPEARVYDPLMPYPEEYPEEYQTIQNGPALIISRTTYTRIPNVTYTTITMVTLPTYRLVEKAEDGFAATLFDVRSSKRDLRDARCNENYSSLAILPQGRRQ